MLPQQTECANFDGVGFILIEVIVFEIFIF